MISPLAPRLTRDSLEFDFPESLSSSLREQAVSRPAVAPASSAMRKRLDFMQFRGLSEGGQRWEPSFPASRIAGGR